MFCCVCFPMEGWHTGTLDCWIQNWVLLPHIGWKLQKTEPTKTTNIADKTAPLASRCFYPVISCPTETGLPRHNLTVELLQDRRFQETWQCHQDHEAYLGVAFRQGGVLECMRRWGFCGWKHHRDSPLFTLLRVAMGLGQWCCLQT